VLGQEPHCIHLKISKEIEMGEGTPQMNLLQMPTIKVAPKIPFAFLKTHIY